jgi:hypothetical protein
MTAGYDDVRRWDAEAVESAATRLRGRRDTLVGLQDELDAAGALPDWHGTAGETARRSLGSTRNNAEVLVAELSAVVRALEDASDEVSRLRSRIADNDALADTYQFRIAADGAIVDIRPADPPPRSRFEAEDRAEAQRYRAAVQQQLGHETTAILTTANSIDTTLAGVMRLALDRKISDHDATTLADAGKGGQLDAQVAELEQSLRDAGLLSGPPAAGHYREWLENTVRRGVPADTIKKMIADHHITPADFRVLDGMEEIREDEDGDGIAKSYFLMPSDISGDDAAKAVRMTYVLNAGTDYGTEGETTDFAPAPYGSDELRRITDRQQRNSFSYDDDVGFVHGNGGRLVTTPNGMMMGLGGNVIQDQFSQRGGTTWGDTFMLNIDDPQDPAQQLREAVGSGHAWYEGDDGAYRGDLTWIGCCTTRSATPSSGRAKATPASSPRTRGSRSPAATRPRKTRDCPMADIAKLLRAACAALLLATVTTACDTEAQFAPSLPPAAGFRVDGGVLKLWTGTPCQGVTGMRLTFDSGTRQSTEQTWTAPRPGVRLERADLVKPGGQPAPDAAGLQVRKPLPPGYDWTTAKSLNFAVDGPTSFGARADVAQVLGESPQHPPESYLFGQRGWLNAADVQRENQKSFLTICTADPN